MASRGLSRQVITQATSSITVNSGVARTFDDATAGIHANDSGLFEGTLLKDNSAVSMRMVAGQTYPISVKSIASGNAIQVVALFNVRG